MRSQLGLKFEDIVSIENLLEAWEGFITGKRNKQDVQVFSLRLMDNLMDLHHDLVNRQYEHGSYYAFSISDPKPRSIHKASVRDRGLTHWLQALDKVSFRLIKWFGFRMKQYAPSSHFLGSETIPTVIRIDRCFEQFKHCNPPLFDFVSQDVEPSRVADQATAVVASMR